MTEAQEIAVDQQHDAEYFRGVYIGYGIVGTLVLIVLYKAWEEWRCRK